MQVDSSRSMDQMSIPGILRLDKTSRSSGFRATPRTLAAIQVGPSSSPSQSQSSASRQSVTFGIVEFQRDEDLVEEDQRSRSERTDTRFRDDTQRISIAEATFSRASPSGTSRNPAPMENKSTADGEETDNEDDYSASVCAIMQRRNSTRRQSRRKRRPSSPFGDNVDGGVACRRSSVYTTSSGDTIISMDESGNQEQIFENLKLHKEVLSGIKQQPWPLRRKLKLVRQAKAYIRRHEGALQERLAQSRSTKDVIARVSIFITKKWQYFRRELINLQTWLIPWEVRIMEIESHFGSAVASYFTFLRWLFWINLVIAAILTAFVAIPEVLIANVTLAGERKIMLKEEAVKSKHLLTLWEFEGVLKYSPFFYGWYTNQNSNSKYKLPLAYFVTNLVVYTYSFVAILRKMAENSRLSKLTEKEDEYVFSWKLLTGWDFMIGNPETAHNRTASVMLGFKEALLEEAEKQKDKRNWRIISMRIFVNIAVLSLLALSAYAVIEVVGRSTTKIDLPNWWRQNEITIVMSLISYLFPILFEILGFLESYHPRKQLRMQLGRIMGLNLLNLYSLIFALFRKISSTKPDIKPTTKCVRKWVPCDDKMTRTQQIMTLASLSLVLINNATHSYAKREISEPTLPSIRQETYFLNPLLDNDTLYKDFNDTYDYNDYNTDYDNYRYETSRTESGDESFTMPYYEEQDTRSADNSEIHYDTSSTVTANFLTDSMTTEHFYASSNSSQSETTATTFESSTMEDSSRTDFDIFTEISIITPSSSDSQTPSVGTFNTSTIADITPITTYIPKSNFPTAQSNKPVIPISKINYVDRCFERVCTTMPKNSAMSLEQLDLTTRQKLRRSCWETMFGQELAKLTVMDLILTILATLCMDFFRAVFVRFMNNCWCWDLEKQFPQYGDFKIAENILHLVNNQGMVWMGMFFSPGLTALNLFKLGILMYLRSWAVLTCNVPHEVVFRASRSNNFYFALLLTMLFLCVLPVGYAIVWVEPSWHCGPFSGYPKIYNLATQSLKDSLPELIQRCLDYVASPGIVIPLIVLMTLIIYYMASLAGSLREANNDLKIQLRHERTEERRKLFKIAEKRHTVTETPLSRWKKILPALPQTRISRDSETVQRDNVQITIGNANDTTENERLTNDIEEDSPQKRILSDVDNEQRAEEQDDLTLNDVISPSRRISVVGCSWDSPTSGQSVIIPEIQVNDEEKVASDVHGTVELGDVSKDDNQKIT
ncbi:transmembrane channel-like protein isoform X2 [Temnothorax longispinosus]|uniref:transmembrane channel-like protein isoform X2 n=1 Tax=Temnothorax longispinosus TaxID=300112 RepID=UPI003A99D523